MQTLRFETPVSDEDAPKLAGSDVVILPTPRGGLDTLRAAVSYIGRVVHDTREAVEAARAIMDDPQGDPGQMGAVLAQLALLAEEHMKAESNVANILTLLGTCLVAKPITPKETLQ